MQFLIEIIIIIESGLSGYIIVYYILVSSLHQAQRFMQKYLVRKKPKKVYVPSITFNLISSEKKIVFHFKIFMINLGLICASFKLKKILN